MSKQRHAIKGTKTNLLNTAATLTDGSLALGSAFDNTAGQTGDGYTAGLFTFSGTFGTAAAANTGLSIWFLLSNDAAGGTYEDGGASVTPARPADLVIPVRAVNSAQVVCRSCDIPPGLWKPLVKNDGTGQTINSGWTLDVEPFTPDFS